MPASNYNPNFLSPTAFKLDLPGFSEVDYQVQEANIPGISMNGPTQATPYNDFQLGGDKLNYQDLIVSFLVDENCINYSLIHDWMVGITYPQKSTQWRDFVKKQVDKKFADVWNIDQVQITLTALNSNYNPSFKIDFVDAFPVSLSTLTFDTTSNDVRYLTATAIFKYTYFKLLNNNNKQLTL